MKRIILAALLVICSAAALSAFDNTTYLGLSAGSSVDRNDDTGRGQMVYGATVFGELLFEDDWYGISFQASALSNFSSDLPSLNVSGGLGVSIKARMGRFSLTFMPGFSLRADSRPAFRQADFYTGVYLETVASFKVSQSFALFAAWDASYYFHQIGEKGTRSFALTNTVTLGMGYQWDPSSPDQRRYVVY